MQLILVGARFLQIHQVHWTTAPLLLNLTFICTQVDVRQVQPRAERVGKVVSLTNVDRLLCHTDHSKE